MTNRDTISIQEKEGAIQVTLKMKSIIPSVRAIQQFEKKFQPQDILTDSKRFENSLYHYITEAFNNYLYEMIDENSNDGIIDYRELL